MSSNEPSIAALPNPLLRYFLATRPAFLSVTLFAALIGLATAYADGVALNAATATATVLFALVAHGGINVLNDYYDSLNGTDAANVERIFPFTGGSRFIQNGVLTLRETALFGVALLLAVMAAGLWLTAVSAPGLIWIGASGLFIGWTYSAPPLKLNSRGWGELCVWAGFALIAVGADFVQRGQVAGSPWFAVASFALLVTNVLYINQFPDRKADEAAGKHHWVVRLGPQRARWGYALIATLSYGWIVVAVALGLLPWLSLAAIAPAVLSARAALDVLKFAARPQELGPAIQQTIAAASAQGLLLAVSIALAHRLGW